jgi:Mannosylglycerate hydrolase MGH1-like glycoside hydrolase domain
MEKYRAVKHHLCAEDRRLEESLNRTRHWKRWGPYLSERQWGTVREDYSPHGTSWDYFPHDQSRSRAYRWGEDGIAGISDRHQLICFSLAFWNGKDPILKERLFGLVPDETNHGEDVKEYYYYLDSTPTHSYMQYLYKYPQRAFPYSQLIEESRRRKKSDPEYELIDTCVFAEDRYFDIFIEYGKASADDILIRVSAFNRGPEAAELHILPTLWFRNTWSWGQDPLKPVLSRATDSRTGRLIHAEHPYYGPRWLSCEGSPALLFTENETNYERVFGTRSPTPYVKDAFHNYVIHSGDGAINPAETGTKAAAHYRFEVPAGGIESIRLRLADRKPEGDPFDDGFEVSFISRIAEANEFYSQRLGKCKSADGTNVQRQAFAGLLWSKQFYHYDVRTWLMGDPGQPPCPGERLRGRNKDWQHLYNADIVSMPDKWEYPWYAAWDLAFHCVGLALIDPDFAKEQLVLMLREWYMHPNGQLPAYEWAFGDVNPPVHAWAAWRVYKIEKRIRGKADTAFLERVFQKLMLNFTWWVNRKDAEGRNVFQGGFLGLDNIGIFDRSAPLPTGGHIEQSDGTGWMGMYCLNMLTIALELARDNPNYQDLASKFFEHFVHIAHAMTDIGGLGFTLWDEHDGFFYDALCLPDGSHHALKARSAVGFIPLFGVETLEPDIVDALGGFNRRMQWFIDNVPHVRKHIDESQTSTEGVRRLLAMVNREQLVRSLRYILDENEFLSPYGVRSLSKVHQTHPFTMQSDGREFKVDYAPAESTTDLFGGNSNWRGPIWFPLNYLLIESLQKFHYYYGGQLKVECPTGSGHFMTLWDVAAELSRRLNRLFLRNKEGRRAVFGEAEKFQTDPNWREYILFYEYFHGDTGQGLGASHQTGWTALVAKMLEQSGE